MARVIGSGVEALKEFVRKCKAAGGVPLIRTKYGGQRLPNNAVIVACWGKGKEVPGGMITDIPANLIEQFEKTTGDYKILLEKY